ncbi:hypothetical protein FOA43_000939 [Brettanomyces nanus]|uniref:Uncharacterized protein n=1 Tax=Eeniella nana TaxID=13502 RepID=A0A875RTL9_EENNA|nr:uncharacterized protein FOA43_000939 [Brettanomyces nanus]QPG73627.1 hypothetical protein FOA43_000939 [Brettanomyces nanus]
MKQVELAFFSSNKVSKKHELEDNDARDKNTKKIRTEEDDIHLATPPTEISDGSDIEVVEEVERGHIDRTEVARINKVTESKRESTPHKNSIEEREQRKIRKEKEAEERRLKKEKETEERRLKKEKLEEKRQLKKEKIEEERRSKKVQKEKEKLERQKKREEKKAEQEVMRKQKEEERQKQIEEKEKEKILAEEQRKKHSITNFFKLKSTTHQDEEYGNEGKYLPIDEIRQDKSDYESFFLPFYVRPETKLVDLRPEKREVDVNSGSSFQSFLRGFKLDEPVHQYSTAQAVVQKMNLGMIKESEDEFMKVPKKFLQFYENVKAPYCGTYSFTIYDVNEDLAINPFAKISTTKDLSINYDYDSDLEKPEDDEEEEGEDIDLEADDEDDEDEDSSDELSGESSDFDGFVEKEDDSQGSSNSKRKILGPLKPESRWIHGTIGDDDAFGQYFNTLGFERLNYTIQFPIDPLCEYWKVEAGSAATPFSTSSSSATASTLQAKKRTITDDADLKRMTEFILQNRDYTLNTLTELMQKQVLSQYSRSMVKNSIRQAAAFDKKKNEWVLNNVVTDTGV